MPLVQNPEYTRAYSKWCGLCLEHDQAVNNAKAGNAGWQDINNAKHAMEQAKDKLSSIPQYIER